MLAKRLDEINPAVGRKLKMKFEKKIYQQITNQVDNLLSKNRGSDIIYERLNAIESILGSLPMNLATPLHVKLTYTKRWLDSLDPSTSTVCLENKRLDENNKNDFTYSFWKNPNQTPWELVTDYMSKRCSIL